MQIADSLFQPPVGLCQRMSKPIATDFDSFLSYRIMKSSVEVIGTSCKDTDKKFCVQFPFIVSKIFVTPFGVEYEKLKTMSHSGFSVFKYKWK